MAAKISPDKGEVVHLLDNRCFISTWKFRNHDQIFILPQMNFGGLDQYHRFSESLRAGRSRFESRCRLDLQDPYRPALRNVQHPVHWSPGLSRGGKAAWAWR